VGAEVSATKSTSPCFVNTSSFANEQSWLALAPCPLCLPSLAAVGLVQLVSIETGLIYLDTVLPLSIEGDITMLAFIVIW